MNLLPESISKRCHLLVDEKNGLIYFCGFRDRAICCACKSYQNFLNYSDHGPKNVSCKWCAYISVLGDESFSESLRVLSVGFQHITCITLSYLLGTVDKQFEEFVKTSNNLLQLNLVSLNFASTTLFDSILSKDSCTVKSIFIRHCTFDGSVIGSIEVFLSCFKSRANLTCFSLKSHGNFTGEICTMLTQGICKNHRLKWFVYESESCRNLSYFGDISIFLDFYNAVINHKGLKRLVIPFNLNTHCDCDIVLHATIISKILQNPQISHFTISSFDKVDYRLLSGEALNIMNNALQNNHTVRSLRIPFTFDKGKEEEKEDLPVKITHNNVGAAKNRYKICLLLLCNWMKNKSRLRFLVKPIVQIIAAYTFLN